MHLRSFRITSELGCSIRGTQNIFSSSTLCFLPRIYPNLRLLLIRIRDEWIVLHFRWERVNTITYSGDSRIGEGWTICLHMSFYSRTRSKVGTTNWTSYFGCIYPIAGRSLWLSASRGIILLLWAFLIGVECHKVLPYNGLIRSRHMSKRKP